MSKEHASGERSHTSAHSSLYSPQVLAYVNKVYNKTEPTSEFFSIAGRSVKTGLAAFVIVSQWTWAATLLQSSSVAWSYDESRLFGYASAATIQVVLFRPPGHRNQKERQNNAHSLWNGVGPLGTTGPLDVAASSYTFT